MADKTTPEPYVCDDCKWRMGWLHWPGQFWCGATALGSRIPNRLDRPDWCPPKLAAIRELHHEQ